MLLLSKNCCDYLLGYFKEKIRLLLIQTSDHTVTNRHWLVVMKQLINRNKTALVPIPYYKLYVYMRPFYLNYLIGE